MKKFKKLRQSIDEAVYRAGFPVGRDASDAGINGEIGLYQTFLRCSMDIQEVSNILIPNIRYFL